MSVLRDGGMEITPGNPPRTGPKHSKAEQDTAKHSKTKHPGQSPQQAPSTAMQSKTQQSKAKRITRGDRPSRPQAQQCKAKHSKTKQSKANQGKPMYKSASSSASRKTIQSEQIKAPRCKAQHTTAKLSKTQQSFTKHGKANHNKPML